MEIGSAKRTSLLWDESREGAGVTEIARGAGETYAPAVQVDLSVVLPAFNEAPALEGVVREIRAALGDWHGTWEILVIDDASTDGTAQRALRAGVRVVQRVENGGYGAAVRRGIVEARGRIVALMDADGSYPPGHLPELLAHIGDYDQINGARSREPGGWRLLRVAAKWFVRKLAERISGKRIPDLNTGMKVFKRDLMLRYLWVLPDGFSCSTSMTLAFLCNDHPVKYVPVAYRKRNGKSKFHPVQDGCGYCFTVLRIMTYFRPLRVFAPLALLVGAVAAAKALYDLAVYPTGIHDSDVILAVTALMILVIGLLADLIVAQRREIR